MNHLQNLQNLETIWKRVSKAFPNFLNLCPVDAGRGGRVRLGENRARKLAKVEPQRADPSRVALKTRARPKYPALQRPWEQL